MIKVITLYISVMIFGVLLIPPALGVFYKYFDPLMEKYLDYVDFCIDKFE